ncbi:MAG: hypothetical protein MJZ75_00770 [Paludibacteraceae bacterium]|nr:hypothetical protein [Paludibacteraceae bacterium]
MKKTLLPLMVLTMLCGVAHATTTEVAPPPPKPECKDIVYRKWNDLLFVDNGDNLFVNYQWYEDGVLMPGETKQYLYNYGVILKGNGKRYYAIVTKADGTQIMTCEYTFEEFNASVELNAAPRKMALYNARTGNKIGEWDEDKVPDDLYLSIAQGVYFWRITDSEHRVEIRKATIY